MPLFTGYLLVSQPIKQVGPEIAIGQKLQIAVELLNVYSDPGLNHDIIWHLSKDTVVIVEALSSEWCLVRLDEKTSGWINSKYTTVLPGEATGS